MSFLSRKKQFLSILGLALLLNGALFGYERYFSATQVGLINYRGFQTARILKANDSEWVEVSSVAKAEISTYDDYDVLILFGRGLSLTSEQLAGLKAASESGVKLYVESATNPRMDVTNISGRVLETMQDYMKYGGEFNYKHMLRYMRHILDGKTYGIDAPELPQSIDSDVLFHIDEAEVFSNVPEYLNYYQTLPSFNERGKKIALLTSVPGPFNANRDHLDALINELESAGMQVFPIASFRRRLEMIKEVSPDAVILMPHGRLSLGKGQDTIGWLKQQNIPLIAPVSVFENYDKWLKNPQGYASNLLTMNIVLPELDGAIAPYAINAQFEDENGYQIFKAIPERLTSFVELLSKWFTLKGTGNQSKKLAIVYFKGPGKNALVAGGLEVALSLFNTLHELKERGYDLGGLPASFSDFDEELNEQGVVMAPYAKGLVEELFDEHSPALISADDYIDWCQNTLAPGMCDRISAAYGKAPGDFMVTKKGGIKHIGVARLQYGNVALVPQPLPGLGEDTFKLIHGTEKAPPHSYVAPYMWIRDVFKADAIMHYGTHGSLEFTQGKQVAQSSYDWSDALIGNTPHLYLYTMSNVGEAIIAKRRSYATILNHLTPPFQEAGLYSELKILADATGQYALTDGPVRHELRQQINALIISLDLLLDLELNNEDLEAPENDWAGMVLLPVQEWLETLAQSKITKGLYTLGVPYQGDEAQSTVRLMVIDTLTQRYAEIQEQLGQEVPEGTQQRDVSISWIERRLTGETSQSLLGELLGDPLLQRVAFWKANNKKLDQNEIIRGFIALSEKSKSTPEASSIVDEELMALTASALADDQTKEFIKGLKSEQSFSHVSQALDPEKAAKAKLLAKVIPAIGRAIGQLEKDDVRQLVIAMQDETARAKVLGWVENDNLSELVEEQKQKQFAVKVGQARSALPTIMSDMAVTTVDWQHLARIVANLSAFDELLTKEPQLLEALTSEIENAGGISSNQFIDQLKNKKSEFVDALATSRQNEEQLALSITYFQQALDNITNYESHLLAGSGEEFRAITNALSGGYTEPASGGDPILNPAALPTGRNMYSIDAEKTPSIAAWNTGKKMAETLLEQHFGEHGEYPEKVSFTLWPSEFIHSQGATIAEALYLLGVEPVRDPFGRVQNLKLIPIEALDRPRIDVVVQSAGQLRDLAASRLALLERAVAMAADANDEDAENNFVAKGVRDAEKYLLDKGVAPAKARAGAYRRSFGGLNGAYGTAIMEKVEQGASWETGEEVAEQYLNNMGAVYGESDSWGEYQPHLFAAALQNTEVVVHPRSSNTWGALSLDHVYEFMGGLSMAVRHVTGNDPSAYFNDFRNPNKAKLQTLNEAVWSELRTTLLNPNYIREMTDGGASSAETFAETFRNTYGWNVMKPEAIDDSVWNKLHETYIEDKNELGIQEFFAEQNPYALQEMTGVMLETARKGLWQASPEQLLAIAELHAKLVNEFEAGCGTFTCGNDKLQNFIKDQLQSGQAASYQAALDAAQIGENSPAGVVLRKEEQVPSSQEQAEQEMAKSEETNTENQSSQTDFNYFWLFLLGLPLSLIILYGWQYVRRS